MILFQDTEQEMELIAEGGVFLRASGSLVVADVHLGKAAMFRARGLAVPEGDDERDLARLAAMVRKFQARELVVAGDLFHAAAGVTTELKGRVESFIKDI